MVGRQEIDEAKNKLWIIDDDAKPLAGSYGQYTRLALLGYRTGGANNRFFAVFAESRKLFDAIHDRLGTADWIREGFEKKFIYIEEVLRKPTDQDDISGAFQKLPDSSLDIWLGVFEKVTEDGILEQFATKVRGKTYGMPKDDLPKIGFPVK